MKPITVLRWRIVGIATAVLCGQAASIPGQPPAPPLPQNGAAPPVTSTFQPTHENIADSLMAHQRYQAAIEQYKLAPASPEVLNKMGVAYQLLFDVGGAGKCYKAALRKEPKNAKYLNNMGSIYMADKEYSTAVKTYRKAVKYDPSSALYQKNLGTALFADRDYKKGWVAYQQALKLDPEIFDHSASVRVENPGTIQDRGAMNFYMAKGCMKAGLPEKAIEYLRLALNEGFITPKKIIADAEFDPLHKVPAFQQMMEAQGVYLNGISAHPQVQQ
ncbi:MAG TPA: tetratricopeptide repeat protein [Terracidiphilus sp.]|nr:tetratricopeptide repeat protein [Terracidiphilus sp.]